MSQKGGEEKDFRPEGALARNLLNTLDSLLATERHYRELAARAKEKDKLEKAEFYEEKQDDVRYLRQKIASLPDWNTESWCSLKGLLKAKHNFEEAYQKIYRDGFETDEVMDLSRKLDQVITEQHEFMLSESSDKA